MLPQLALLVAASAPAWSELKLRSAQLRFAPAAVAVLGAALGCGILLSQARVFAHTASERIAAELQAHSQVADLVVLHDESAAWGHLYFPLRYLFGPGLRQTLVQTDPMTGSLSVSTISEPRTAIAIEQLRALKVVLLSTQPQGFEQLGAFVRSGTAPSLVAEPLRSGLEKVGCRATSSQVFVAFAASELQWLKCAP
jgi:hypothetical protein